MRLTIVFLLMCSLAFGQNNTPDSRFAIGGYGFGYKKYTTNVFAGLLFDFKPKDKKYLEFSTSATYYHLNYGNNMQYRLNSFSLTSGISLNFGIGNLHVIPGIQLGYLHWDKEEDVDQFSKFHGAGALAKLDLYYRIKNISIGARYSFMLATGGEYIDTPFVLEPHWSYFSSTKGLMEFGISLRYHF